MYGTMSLVRHYKHWEKERGIMAWLIRKCTLEMRAHHSELVSHAKAEEKKRKMCLHFPVPFQFFLADVRFSCGFCNVVELESLLKPSKHTFCIKQVKKVCLNSLKISCQTVC